MSWNTSDRRTRLPSDWEAVRRRVLRRDGQLCQIRRPGCLGRASDVDHIRRGDDHSDENLQSVCASCHARKSSAEGNARRRELKRLRKRPAERHPGRI